MNNRAMFVGVGGGYESVRLGACDAPPPRVAEITVRLHASSLNYHDFLVVHGEMGPREPRIPMSDGAGEVIAVGAGVTEFAVGDHVVSAFFPTGSTASPRETISHASRATVCTAMRGSESPAGRTISRRRRAATRMRKPRR